MRIPLSFKGQSVFVAGGSSGINLGIATAFAQAGAKVAIASRNAERVAQAVAQLRQHGTQIEGYSADVRDAAGIARLTCWCRARRATFWRPLWGCRPTVSRR